MEYHQHYPPPPPPLQLNTSASSLSPLKPGRQAYQTFDQVAQHGPPTRPLDFPPPTVIAGVRVNALVVHPETGARQVCSGVVHREDLSSINTTTNHPSRNRNTRNRYRRNRGRLNSEPVQQPPPLPSLSEQSSQQYPQSPRQELAQEFNSLDFDTPRQHYNDPNDDPDPFEDDDDSHDEEDDEILAYWPQRRLQDAIYGSVWACLVLKRHYGSAADDAARAAGVPPDSPAAPMVWELTHAHVAIKMVEWARVHHMRGRLLEDPVKEVAALQLLGRNSTTNNKSRQHHVLGSTEVLQDRDFLYSVMPYCRDGDLFGVVVQYAEESGGEVGMPEPVARFWFKQILQGLDQLQRQGICHRDLSLENVLVDGERCMIIDMGMCLRVPYNNTHYHHHHSSHHPPSYHNDPTSNATSTTTTTTSSTTAHHHHHKEQSSFSSQTGAGLATAAASTTTTIAAHDNSDSEPLQLQRRLMKPQGVCGKHNYMSPEVFCNTDPFDGFAIDLWAAGVILYIMLTGFPPYDQASRTDQRFELIVNGRLVEQLRNWNIFLTDEAGHLIQSMLMFDPRERLTLAEVMAHDWVTNAHVQPPTPTTAANSHAHSSPA